MEPESADDPSGDADDPGSSGDLAALIAHDLKNHLVVAERRLEGYVEDEGGDRRLEAVAESLRRMKEVTDQVLELSTGAEELEVRDVDVEEVARDVWRNLDAGDCDLRLKEPPVVEADPGALARLLENLFGNSLEHGGGEVTVTVGGRADGFYVEDDGHGIASGVEGDVFERGISSAGGTGLGLYIVGRVADLHGWEVEAVGADSGGARFEFTVD